MNAVIGYTDLMLLEDKGDRQLSKANREYLKIIRSSGKLLLTIISDILDVSKIEAGELKMESKPYSLQETLKSVYNNARSLVTSKGRDSVILDFQMSLPSCSCGEEEVTIADVIIGDPVRLQQVLHNLLSNAIKVRA